IAGNLAVDVPSAVGETALYSAGEGQPPTLENLRAAGGIAAVASVIGNMRGGSVSALAGELQQRAQVDQTLQAQADATQMVRQAADELAAEQRQAQVVQRIPQGEGGDPLGQRNEGRQARQGEGLLTGQSLTPQ